MYGMHFNHPFSCIAGIGLSTVTRTVFCGHERSDPVVIHAYDLSVRSLTEDIAQNLAHVEYCDVVSRRLRQVKFLRLVGRKRSPQLVTRLMRLLRIEITA